jgi:thymidine kinase
LQCPGSSFGIVENLFKGFVRRRVGLVKSDKDTRYGVAAVVSHDGVQMPCVAAPSLATFREHIGEEEYKQVYFV